MRTKPSAKPSAKARRVRMLGAAIHQGWRVQECRTMRDEMARIRYVQLYRTAANQPVCRAPTPRLADEPVLCEKPVCSRVATGAGCEAAPEDLIMALKERLFYQYR